MSEAWFPDLRKHSEKVPDRVDKCSESRRNNVGLMKSNLKCTAFCRKALLDKNYVSFSFSCSYCV